MSEFPIGQPAAGWDEAQRKASGYSRTQVYRQKAYYCRNKDEIKKRREEKMAREAGVPVSKKAKPLYGDIADSIEIKTIRRFARRIKRCMIAYMGG